MSSPSTDCFLRSSLNPQLMAFRGSGRVRLKGSRDFWSGKGVRAVIYYEEYEGGEAKTLIMATEAKVARFRTST